MSLLHATWLPRRGSFPNTFQDALLIWADTWKVAKPIKPKLTPAIHPFTLKAAELRNWLNEKDLLPKESVDAIACLTLPSKTIQSKNKCFWTGLPLQAGEPIPEKFEWWPWEIEGIAISPKEASTWLGKLPLSGTDAELGEELLWWSHLERWSLSLIARQRWLPQVDIAKENPIAAIAHWIPLLNREEDSQLLENFANKLPRIATCVTYWQPHLDKNIPSFEKSHPMATCLLTSGRKIVPQILEELLDAQLRHEFKPKAENLDPLLIAWQKGLGSNTKTVDLPNEEIERLAITSKHWKEKISGDFAPARACLELYAPTGKEELWEVRFSLQAHSDHRIKVPASTVWAAGQSNIQLGEITIEDPSEILLEGLGRALHIFQPIERGLENAAPQAMSISGTEAFILIRTASTKLRDIGIGVELPASLSGGLASRLGLCIQAELKEMSNGFTLGDNLEWNWKLMIGGITLTLKELQKLFNKESPLVNHKNTWIELRPNDLKNAEKFFLNKFDLNLDDALRLTATDGNTFQKLPVHLFDAGPRLQAVLDKYHQLKSPERQPAPYGFCGQLRPYQERGLGWLSFLYRFNQGACLADDMGLGKTIQILAFIQSLKEQKQLKQTILLVAPTSILINWAREAHKFTPKLAVIEHYGPKRASSLTEIKESLKKVDLVITSYGLLQRDLDLLKTIKWQGIIIDEAQAIKNPNAKQSKATREIALLQNNCFRIALTGTPIENRISDLWAIMNFLNPSVLGEENFFHQRYRLPIESYGDISSLKDLKSRVSPFILRRVKTDKAIISDLPKKVELNEWVDLTTEQKTLYKKTVDTTLLQISTAPLGQRQGQVLGLLTRLKQICNHPGLALKEENIDDNFLERSAKLQRLEEILEEVIAADDKALLFTQFAEWGHKLKAYWQKTKGLEVPFLHGATSKKDRQSMIDRFQEDPRGPQLFLLSLKAGGVGINLTRANHVFHLDRWWNPAVENQATDRAYRIGQLNRVMVHKFITRGSVEEKINQMIIKKSQLSDEIIGSGEDWLGKLEVNELRQLVALDNSSL